MRKFIALVALATSFASFASDIKVEFDEAQEIKCYQESQKLGCLDGETENLQCLQTKKTKLSAECRSMLTEKINNQ